MWTKIYQYPYLCLKNTFKISECYVKSVIQNKIVEKKIQKLFHEYLIHMKVDGVFFAK